jgi:hypothetical protein
MLSGLMACGQQNAATVVVAILAITLARPVLVEAQGVEPVTRAEVWRAEREAKARALRPSKPTQVERVALRAENSQQSFINPVKGIYPRLGSFVTGSGFALGPGYRDRTLFGNRATLDVSGAISSKKYWVAEAKLSTTALARGRAFGEVYGRHRDMPEETFFGLGPDSLRSDITTFTLRDTAVGASGGVRLVPWLALGGGVEGLAASTADGHRKNTPNIDSVFSVEEVPGFGASPGFVHSSVFIDVNFREPRGNPRDHGQYRVTLNRFTDHDDVGVGFKRIDVDVQQYFSILHQKRVLALHGLYSTSVTDPGDQVPFYLQQYLGGSETLRGFRDYRFRGPHVLLLQAEYRFEVFTALDFALFYDAGKVAMQRADLDLRDLETNAGFGFRFGTIQGVFLRLDAAFGSADGPHYYMKFGHVF